MDESRKQFEEWIASTTNSDLHRGVMLDRRESGRYSHLATENKWEAWQASRAAIEIDAPAEPFYPMPKENSPTDHYHYGRQSIISKVRVAGIKVKE